MVQEEVLKNDPGFSDIPQDQVNKYGANAAVHVPGIANEKVVEYYSGWAEKYDDDLNPDTYRGPDIAASFCNILYPDKNIRILDIGAGTG
jgi:hypothetical protein